MCQAAGFDRNVPMRLGLGAVFVMHACGQSERHQCVKLDNQTRSGPVSLHAMRAGLAVYGGLCRVSNAQRRRREYSSCLCDGVELRADAREKDRVFVGTQWNGIGASSQRVWLSRVGSGRYGQERVAIVTAAYQQAFAARMGS